MKNSENVEVSDDEREDSVMLKSKQMRMKIQDIQVSRNLGNKSD